jgi:sterol desaturase/sphingolipid hydroxylase (fatty acid hydroxylase superfamily)
MATASTTLFTLPDDFTLADHNSWPYWFIAAFVGVIFVGLQILSFIVPVLFGSASPLPHKGTHLDQLSRLDRACIFINKCVTCVFVYHTIVVTTKMSNITWGWHNVNVFNTLGSLIAFYIFYDFFYTLFHRALHIRSVYPLIHKHHHRQKAPSRGTVPYGTFVCVLLTVITLFRRQFRRYQCASL